MKRDVIALRGAAGSPRVLCHKRSVINDHMGSQPKLHVVESRGVSCRDKTLANLTSGIPPALFSLHSYFLWSKIIALFYS